MPYKRKSKSQRKKIIQVALSGSRLRQARDQAGLTQRELADKIGIAEVTIYRYEAESSTPTFANIVAMSKYLNVSMDWLAGLSENPQSHKSDGLSETESKLIRTFRNGDLAGLLEIFKQILIEHDQSR